MPAQYHFDFLFDEIVDSASRAWHGNIENAIVSGSKLMMSDNDTDLVLGHVRKNLAAMFQLMPIESAIGDAAPRRGGIEANQHRIPDLQNRIQVGRNDFAVQCVRPEQTFEYPPQRDVMVTGDDEHWVV